MHKEGDEIHIEDTEARAGATDKKAHVRWILTIGMLLAIGVLTLIWMTGAISQSEVEEEVAAGTAIAD